MHPSEDFISNTLWILTVNENVTFAIPIAKMRKLRFREVQQPDQEYNARGEWGRNSSSGRQTADLCPTPCAGTSSQAVKL